MTNRDTEKKAALKVYTRTAGLTLLELMTLPEQDGYSWKLNGRTTGEQCRYRAQVYRMDDGGGGRYTFSQNPVKALTEAWASAARCRVRNMIEEWKTAGTDAREKPQQGGGLGGEAS